MIKIRHNIKQLDIASNKSGVAEQIKKMTNMKIKNFIILARYKHQCKNYKRFKTYLSPENIDMTLNAANDLKLHGEQFGWFAVTKVRNQIQFHVNLCDTLLG